MSHRVVHMTTIPLTFIFLGGHVNYLKQHGFEVHAVSSPGEGLDRFARQHDVAAHAVAMRRAISPLHDLGAILRLTWLFMRLRPEIVHAHTPKGAFLGMVCSWLARTPIRIYHVHGVRLDTTTGYRRLLLRWSELVACRLSHHILCVSDSARALMLDLKLCPPEKIEVLVNGSICGVDADGVFNPARFGDAMRAETRAACGIPDGAPVIGFAGRIAADKGVAELTTAWQTLRAEFPSARLLLAGFFDAADPVPDATRAWLETDERVHLPGFVDDVASLYSIMDVLVLPTRREGFGLVLLEGSAMRLPVVANRVVGCVDAVVDGVTGTLVAPDDPAALVAAVRAYLQDAELRSRHGQAGRERALRDFQPQALWQATLETYRQLMKS
jgi:glycosyltransferase involved in cell wall biosynthesis